MMGNNAMCRVIDIGNVRLMMHDKTMLEIKYVRHVSNLKRNLISLGLETFTPMVTYDSNACQYQITTKTEMVIDRHASTQHAE